MRHLRLLFSFLTLLLVGCDAQPSVSTTQPTQTSIRTGFPAFSDYRAAYVDKQYFIHAVTFDSKTDVKGLQLPNLKGSLGFNVGHEGTSFDGAHFAYSSAPVSSPQFSLIGLSSTTADDQAEHYFADTHLTGSYGSTFWSPDGLHIAAYAQDVLYVAGLKDNDFQPIPHAERISLLGWQDASHIIGELYYTSRAIISIDIATGQQQTLYSFPNPAAGVGDVIISPDGNYGLFYNIAREPGDEPSRVALIDFTKGTYTPLTKLLQQKLVYFNSIAWKPNSLKVAVGVGAPEEHDVKSYLLDLNQGTATPLLADQLPQRWSPDGATLIVSDGGDWQVDRGPYTISAVQFGADGTPQVTALTHDAYSFPFPGFVKSA